MYDVRLTTYDLIALPAFKKKKPTEITAGPTNNL